MLKKMQKFDHLVDNVGSPAATLFWEAHKFTIEGAVYV